MLTQNHNFFAICHAQKEYSIWNKPFLAFSGTFWDGTVHPVLLDRRCHIVCGAICNQ